MKIATFGRASETTRGLFYSLVKEDGSIKFVCQPINRPARTTTDPAKQVPQAQCFVDPS
jgi:hypothetical protein